MQALAVPLNRNVLSTRGRLVKSWCADYIDRVNVTVI